MAKPGTFQKGNKNGYGSVGRARPDFLTQALISQLHEIGRDSNGKVLRHFDHSERRRLDIIIDKLIQLAMGIYEIKRANGKRVRVEGPPNLEAIKEIFKQTQGMPKQQVSIGDEDGNELQISVIRRIIVDPASNITRESPPLLEATAVRVEPRANGRGNGSSK